MFCSQCNAVCRLAAGEGGPQRGTGDSLLHVGMRLILGGIAALMTGLAAEEIVVRSVGPHEIEGTYRRFNPPASLPERASFDQHFSFDERFPSNPPSDSFGERFAAAAVSLPVPQFMATNAHENRGNMSSVPSSDPQGACSGDSCRRPVTTPKLVSLPLPPPRAAAKKVQLASLEIPNGSSLDPDSRTAVYDITARTVYMPDGRRLEAHSGLGDRMDDPRYVDVKGEGPTPPNVYDLSLREKLFHGVRALRMTPVGDGKMYGRDGILAHSYMLAANGESNGCVSFSDYPAFLNAFLRGEVTRLVVVERLENPSSIQIISASLWKPFLNLFSGPPTAAQPERAAGYAAAGN
jgi:hypothetical protein